MKKVIIVMFTAALVVVCGLIITEAAITELTGLPTIISPAIVTLSEFVARHL
ncbi:MAG: hypothetical protein LBL34_05665 [Clostridiales bacterium]|jgi:hypothetical protein|nr:hypothetical protein [Clostridiales bacterium]